MSKIGVQERLRQANRILEAVSLAQSRFIADVGVRELFEGLLHDFLYLTESEYGFIGEVLLDPEGHSYLKEHAITNIAWDEATRQFYEEHKESGLEFHNLKTLFWRRYHDRKAGHCQPPCYGSPAWRVAAGASTSQSVYGASIL